MLTNLVSHLFRQDFPLPFAPFPPIFIVFMLSIESICDEERGEWYRMTPQDRWLESERLWATFLALGGSLDPSPIHKVLSTMSQHGVQCLLMGGQACVLYGAAEFSRDTDFAILAEQKNLDILRRALADLQAETIAVPPLEKRFLDRGHAVHFRCAHPEALRLRIDVMARMRGTEDFAALWQRRTTFDLPFGLSVEAMSLPDLVQAKKTQRNKDWPMIQRLLEANYFENRQQPTPQRIVFWLRELRTAPLLIEAAASFPSRAAEMPTRTPPGQARSAGRNRST